MSDPKNPGLDLEEEDSLVPETAAAASKPVATKAAIVDDDVEFGDEGEYSKPGELAVLKTPDKGVFVRFSILAHPVTGKAILKKGYVHYVKDKGYARCISKRDPKGNFIGAPEFCCKEKPGDPRYAALIVQYTNINPASGKFLKSVEASIHIKALCLTRFGYIDVSQLSQEGEDGISTPLTSMDITATPKAETKGLKFNSATKTPAWKPLPTPRPEVWDAMTPEQQEEFKAKQISRAAVQAIVSKEMIPFIDGEELRRKIGKTLSRSDMKVFMGVGSAASDDGPGMEDLAD